jgi:hypothetical protein
MNPTNQKFTDQQFLEQYNKGLYDTEIAYMFNVTHTTVGKRRWKLNLLPNYTIRTSTVTNPKQHLQDKNRHDEHINYLIHKDQIHEKVKNYRQKHLQQIREHARKYYQQHKNKMNENQRNRYQKQLEQIHEYTRRYRQQHKDKIKEYRKKDYQKHKEQINYHNYLYRYKQYLNKNKPT